MKNRLLSITALWATTGLSAAIPAQQPANAAQWRVMLEKAVFARAYEGNPAATKELFEGALAAAKASGDPAAEAEVRRQQANPTTQQDPRAEQVIGRLLQSIAATTLADRRNKIRSLSWDFYQRDPATARSIAKCLDGEVVVGDVVVSLRVEDVMMISDELEPRQNIEILRTALAHEDAFIRTMAVRRCDPEQHLPLILQALTDKNQLVREAACDYLPDQLSPEGQTALLRALDLGTVGAIARAVNAPGFLPRMEKASHDSWLARSMLDRNTEPTVEHWDANLIGKVTRLLQWAKASGKGVHAMRFLGLAYIWLSAQPASPGYPHALARECIDLCLANAEGTWSNDNLENLGVIVRDLGSIDDLAALAPRWILDDHHHDDCSSLFRKCKQLGKEHTEQLIAIGMDLARVLTKDKQSERTLRLFGSYWSNLGGHAWSRTDAAQLEKALDALATLPDNLRDAAYPLFVMGVRASTNRPDLAAIMVPHYVHLATERLVPLASCIVLANHLVAAGSEHSADVALALKGEWNVRLQREHYGDFLRRACARAGENGKRAVLAAVRSGYTQRPSVVIGQQMTETSWPAQMVGGGGGRGSMSNHWIPTPPPTDKIVLKKEDRVAQLPSLLCVLPPDLAAAAARELWTDEDSPITRAELVDVLLVARSSRVALDALVQGFEQITDLPSKAEVLRVFGEQLHPDGRRLIALSLDSPEPVIRHAALEAAEKVLAHVRAQQGMRVYRDGAR